MEQVLSYAMLSMAIALLAVLMRMARPGAFEEPERNIAGAAGHIQQALPGARGQPIHHRVFPDAVDADAHHIVHYVIFGRNRIEHALHPPGLFRLRDRLVAEMGGFGGVVSHTHIPSVVCLVPYSLDERKTNGRK